MSVSDHERLREWAGAYTLRALEPDDRREFELHLRTCLDCQAEVGRLAALPGLLAQIESDELEDQPDGAMAATIERRARAELAGLITSRRRWRRTAIVAAVALVAACGVAVAGAWPGTEPSAPGVELVVGETTATAASIRAEGKGWGTELHAELAGLPERDSYQLWTVDRDGAWVVAATWGRTPAGGARVIGASSAPIDHLRRIVVTSQDRTDVIVDASLGG